MILGLHKFLIILITTSFALTLRGQPIEVNVAEIQILDKITAKVKSYEILSNQNLNIGSLKIEVFACFTNPPEEIPEDYVLLKIYDDIDNHNQNLIYQGWMISSSPASTPLEHPIYDLWLKDCKTESEF